MNSNSKCDVVIVGAGPYGLSAAAHLRTITGSYCARIRKADVLLGVQYAQGHAVALQLDRYAHRGSDAIVDARGFSTGKWYPLFNTGAARTIREVRPVVPTAGASRS